MTPSGSLSALPNLLIAGVPKGGTTSLFSYLAQHPEIGASRKKELCYFEPLLYGEPMRPPQEYAREFAQCADRRFRMESTPNYFFGGRHVAARIDDTLEDCRVIICLREPIDRCWSWYRFVRARARIPSDLDFGRYLDICEGLHRTGEDDLRVNQPFTGLGGSIYDERLSAWLDIFDDRLHICDFAELATDPARAVERILRWLGLDPTPVSGFRYDVENRTVPYRNRSAQRLAVVVNRRAERFFQRHMELKRAVRRVYYSLNADDHEERLALPERERLARFYAPHNRNLVDVLLRAGRRHPPAWLSATPA